jgi:hypothetical protein
LKSSGSDCACTEVISGAKLIILFERVSLMFPFIFIAVAAGSAVYGALKGIDGVSNISEAKEIISAAKKSYEQAFKEYTLVAESTELKLEEFNRFKIDVQVSTFNYYILLKQQLGDSSAERQSQFAKDLNHNILERFQQYQSGELSAEEFFKATEEAFDILEKTTNIFTSGQHNGLLAIGATKIATTVGFASTGTAISGLSGAAAHSATLAWLGGGSLATGGGGMALGGMVLTGLTAGPALAILGFTLAGKGENDIKQAIEYGEEVEKEITKLLAGIEKLKHIQQRIYEMSCLISDKHTILREQMSKIDTDVNSCVTNQITQSLVLQRIEELIRDMFRFIKQPVTD